MSIYDKDGLASPQFRGLLQVRTGEASTAREAPVSGMCDEHDVHEHQQQQQPHHLTHEHLHQQHLHHHSNPHHHQMATTAFHISRPSPPISTIISPPPLHHTSINILDHDSYHVSTIMLQNENFQVKPPI